MASELPSRNHDQSHWFSNEVHPHESALRSYVKNQFPKIRDVDDVVQESFLKIWSAHAKKPILSAKAFLFRIARHSAIDLIRRSKNSPINDVGDGSSVVDVVSVAEKKRMVIKAIDALPSRCREVFIMRKLKNMPQSEVALALGVSERTVETQLSRGMKRCEVFLRKQGAETYFDNESF
mgnify:CR=1 FL=1